MSDRSRANLLTSVVLAVVFASGALVGLAVDQRLGATPPEAAAESDGREEGSEGRRTPMYEQVGLTDAQRVRVDSIVVHHRSAMRRLQEEFNAAYDPRYREIIDSTRAAILAVMDSDQQARYQSLIDDFDARRRERREAERDG